jgi:hypothetical protein
LLLLLLLLLLLAPLGGRRRAWRVVADDGTVLVQLDTAWERPGSWRRRYGSTGRDISLLVVRVLF